MSIATETLRAMIEALNETVESACHAGEMQSGAAQQQIVLNVALESVQRAEAAAAPAEDAKDGLAAMEDYLKRVRFLGYSSKEATLLIIGFSAGWAAFDRALKRVVNAIKKA